MLIYLTITASKGPEEDGKDKKGSGCFVNYGNYIVNTVALGDVLSGIGQRFGVNYMQIAQWNNIKNPDLISISQKLTIYPAVIR